MKNWCFKQDGSIQDHCRDRIHCRTCRADQPWRSRKTKHFEVPENFDRACPFGVTLKKLNRMPSPWQMLKNLLRTIKRIIVYYYQYRRLLAPRAERKRRMNICRPCGYFWPKTKRCLACGCCMKAKVMLEAAECKMELW